MIDWEISETKKKFDKSIPLGARRTEFAIAPERDLSISTQPWLKEPITVVISKKGWMRAMKGHLASTDALTFKEGDGLFLAFHAQTTDCILVMTTGGKFTPLAQIDCLVGAAMVSLSIM